MMEVTKEAAKRFASLYLKILGHTDHLHNKDEFIKTLMDTYGYSKEGAELIWYYIELERDGVSDEI